MDTFSGIGYATGLISSPLKRILRSLQKQPGAPPGTMVYTGPARIEPVRVHLIEYDEDTLDEADLSATEITDISKRPRLTWINVDGLNDLEFIRGIGSEFDLHPLVLEDLVHTGHTPKLEEYDDYLFIVLRMLSQESGTHRVRSEQVGIVFGDGYVLSFQERGGDVWDAVRERIQGRVGRIRRGGADFLAYALVDAIVDHYFHILEMLAGHLEDLEAEVLESPARETMHRIHELRQEMLLVRRAVWPLRELIHGLIRTESSLVEPETDVFLRDVYDHTVQVIDTAEILRDVVTGLMDLYISSVSNRMNEIMKVLTIMASIFIPLTFLAGIYGMNFEYMPELGMRWGYPVLWAVMIGLGAGLLFFFKRRGWL